MKRKKKKKRAKTKKRRSPRFPLPIGIKAPPAVGAVDVPEEMEITCPMCKTHWANARIKFGQPIRRADFAIRKDLKNQVTFDKKSGLPHCPLCSFEYTPKAIYGLMMAAATRAKMERDLWGATRFHKSPLPGEKRPLRPGEQKPPSFGKG